MKYLFFAALTALAVSGCTTVRNTPDSSDMTTVESMPQKAPAGAVQGSTDHNFGHAASDHSGYTLLYGAMTKFEPMSFVEIISAGDQQTVLEQDNMVTVFAPNNSAFKYAGRPDQTNIVRFLSDHMIAGQYDHESLTAAISKNGGPVELQTLSGQTMTVYSMHGKIKLSGSNGVLETITQSDMMHSNGVMHQISDVLGR